MIVPKFNCQRTIAIVPCRTLSLTDFTLFMNSNEKLFSHIVFSTQEEPQWASVRKSEKFSIICFPSQRGISAARNRGMESVGYTQTIFFFPNLSTQFDSDYVENVLRLFSLDRSLGAISGSYMFKGQDFGHGVSGKLQGHDLFLAYEPTLAIRGDALKYSSIKFNEALGTGNLQSKRWSGEGTELLHRLDECGFKVLRITATAGTDLRPKAKHSKSVDFKYGRGYIHVCKIIGGNVNAVYRAFKTINKLVPVQRRQRNNQLGFLNSFAFICGCYFELLGSYIRKEKS